MSKHQHPRIRRVRVAAATALIAAGVCGCDKKTEAVGQAAEDAVTATKQAGEAVGENAAAAGKAVGENAAAAGKAVGKAAATAADSVADKAKEIGHGVKKGVDQATD